MMKNKYVIDGDTLIIYNRKDNREMLFDADDFDKVNQYTWHIVKDITTTDYVNTNIRNLNKKYKSLRAHRLLMNEPINMLVDHINGNGLDNRKSNLRIADDTINNHNNTKAKGYCWHKKNKIYTAYITANKKKIYLGSYNTEAEARAAYLKAKQKYHPTAPIHLYK